MNWPYKLAGREVCYRVPSLCSGQEKNLMLSATSQLVCSTWFRCLCFYSERSEESLLL